MPFIAMMLLAGFIACITLVTAAPHHKKPDWVEANDKAQFPTWMPWWYDKDGQEITQMYFEAQLTGYDQLGCQDKCAINGESTTFHAINGKNCVNLNQPVQSFRVDAINVRDRNQIYHTKYWKDVEDMIHRGQFAGVEVLKMPFCEIRAYEEEKCGGSNVLSWSTDLISRNATSLNLEELPWCSKTEEEIHSLRGDNGTFVAKSVLVGCHGSFK